VRRLNAFRREYGRENEPFEVMLALLEPPSPDLYKRAEEAGISMVMCSPWAGVDLPSGGVERYREAIERFAETIIEKVNA
jgi:hypothetical protein